MVGLLYPICSRDWITIGYRLDNGEPVRLRNSYFDTHIYNPAFSGSGKSVLQMIVGWSRMIRRDHCVIWIDMVGESGKQTKKFLGMVNQTLSLQKNSPYPIYAKQAERMTDEFFSDIHMVDFSLPKNKYRFNCLQIQSEYGHTGVLLAGDFVKAVDRAVNTSPGSDMNQTRQLQNNLRSGGALVAELNGVISDIYKLYDLEGEDIHRYVEYMDNRSLETTGKKVNLPFAKDYLLRYVAQTKRNAKERREIKSSLMNLYGSLFSTTEIDDFLNQSPLSNLDIDDIVRNGGVLILNLPVSLDYNVRIFISALILNYVMSAASRRKSKDKKIFLMADEFQTIFGPSFADNIATCRNIGVQMFLSNQNLSQLKTATGSFQFGETIMANSSVHIYGGMGDEDALKAARIVDRADGRKLKNEYEEKSESVSHSELVSFSKSVTETISQALSKTDTRTFTDSHGNTWSYAENNGIARTWSESLGIAFTKGHNFTRSESTTTGTTITHGKSGTIIEMNGQAQGNAVSKAHSETDTSSTGRTNSTGDAATTSFTGDLGMDSAMGAARMGRGENRSTNRGSSDGNAHSVGHVHADSISNIVNSARSMSNGTNSNISGQRSKTKGTTEGWNSSETQNSAFTEGVSCNQGLTKGIAESISQSKGRSSGRTETETHGESTGYTESRSTGTTKGTATAQKKAFFSVPEEIQMQAYEFQNLKKREFIYYNRITGERFKFRTADMPIDDMDCRLFGVDYEADALERIRPLAVADISTGNVFERIEAELAQSLSFEEPEGV